VTTGARLLTERQADVLWLCCMLGWTEQEVGQAMHISRQAVHAHKARGLERLGKALAEGADLKAIMWREVLHTDGELVDPVVLFWEHYWKTVHAGLERLTMEQRFIVRARMLGVSWGEIADQLGKDRRERGNLCRTFQRSLKRVCGEYYDFTVLTQKAMWGVVRPPDDR